MSVGAKLAMWPVSDTEERPPQIQQLRILTHLRSLILTYHSHHMAGSDYASNDHVALRTDLPLLGEAGYHIVSLAELVDRFRAEKSGQSSHAHEAPCAAITFDDGPEYDAVDYLHPTFGPQRSFLGILQDFAQSPAGILQADICATSFVIACPAARKVMEDFTRTGPYFLHAGAMNDDWWSRAIDSGFMSIANHSWDHLHPALDQVAHSRQARADFTQVDNQSDADAQILAAAKYIDGRTNGRASPFFAYPFGQYNEFLVEEYFPDNRSQAGIQAAVTVDGRHLAAADSIWTLPRYSCGYNWNSPAELLALLNTA